jgi:nuclear pore complex protein Nup160
MQTYTFVTKVEEKATEKATEESTEESPEKADTPVNVMQQVLVVCVPTPLSTISGGIFQIRDAKTLVEKASHPASSATTNCRLQDILVVKDTLYALWEKQGQSRIEMCKLTVGGFRGEWMTAVHGQAADLSQLLSDELLLQPGCLAENFMQALLRPGVFSSLTLRSALQDYREHYLSLPGIGAPALLSSHATLCEGIAAIVGCTVGLTRDTHTGVAQWMQYWNALRRDWEGFVARCIEIERNARWPLSLGYMGSLDQVVVVERERIAQCISRDYQTFLQASLLARQPIQTDYALLPLCWSLRAKLGNQIARKIEIEALNILTQEIAFPLADIVAEASRKVFSRLDVDEATETWVNSQLPQPPEFSGAVHKLLDLIGGLDESIKREEDEVEMIIPPTTLEWARAHITSFITETIEARYDICIAMMVLLFFMGDDLKQHDPALLGEAFAAFRGVVMLRFLCRQNAGDPDGARPYVLNPPSDDVVARMNSLRMSNESGNMHPTYSLMHELTTQSILPSSTYSAAHHFLAEVNILSTVSAAHAFGPEVALCEKLRLGGFHEACRQLLGWLPRSPAVCYVQARLLLDSGRGDESALLFKSVAGSFGK